MIKRLKNLFWNAFTSIDACLKFPNLKNEDIGIQLGFDMTSSITSDLFAMHRRVGDKGMVIGIDPDPFNHEVAQKIVVKNNMNIKLLQKGTYSKKGTVSFLLGEKSGWNQLETIPKDTTVSFSDREINVEIDTLDSIVHELKLDVQQIRHINLTINGRSTPRY